MSITTRLKKLEQTASSRVNEFDHIDVCFKNENILTGVRRLWVNSDRPDEELTPEEYRMEKTGDGIGAKLAAARARVQRMANKQN